MELNLKRYQSYGSIIPLYLSELNHGVLIPILENLESQIIVDLKNAVKNRENTLFEIILNEDWDYYTELILLDSALTIRIFEDGIPVDYPYLTMDVESGFKEVKTIPIDSKINFLNFNCESMNDFQSILAKVRERASILGIVNHSQIIPNLVQCQNGKFIFPYLDSNGDHSLKEIWRFSE